MLLRIVRKWNCSETLRSRRVSKNLHPNEPRNLPSIEREAITRQVVLLVQADRSQPIVFVFELIKSLGCSSINCSRLNDFCCIPHPTAGSSTSVSFAFSVGKLIEWNNSRIGLIFVAQSEEDKWNHSAVKYREKKAFMSETSTETTTATATATSMETKEDEKKEDAFAVAKVSATAAKKNYTDWPLRNIKEPHDNDVLYGRGGEDRTIP